MFMIHTVFVAFITIIIITMNIINGSPETVERFPGLKIRMSFTEALLGGSLGFSGTIQVMANQLSTAHQGLTVSKVIILICQASRIIWWIDSHTVIMLGKKGVSK